MTTSFKTTNKTDKYGYKKVVAVNQIAVSHILFHWAEAHAIIEGMTVKTWQEANDLLKLVGKEEAEINAKLKPEMRGGYAKVKFSVFYTDGEEYQGRFDVNAAHAEVADLGQHMLDFLLYESGQACPKWYNEEQKASYAKRTEKQIADDKEINAWLNKYEIKTFGGKGGC